MNLTKRHILSILLIILALLLLLTPEEPAYTEIGMASYYARPLEGNITANGEIYYHDSLTAAHLTLSFGTRLKVENLENGEWVAVRINDRGRYVNDHILELTKPAFKEISPLSAGLIKVKITEIN
jgi:rare lipoprotein A